MSNARSHVLVVSLSGWRGGSVISLLTVVEASRNTRYLAAGPFHPSISEQLLQSQSVDEVIGLPGMKNARSKVWSAISLTAILLARRSKVRAVWANGLSEAAISVLACALIRKPLIVWIHNTELPVSARLFKRLLASRLVHVKWLAVSTVASTLSAPVRGRRACFIVPNPINADAISQRRTQAPTTVSTMPFKIGVLGTLRYRKGVDVIPSILAAARMATSRELELFIFGGIKNAMPEFREWIESLPAGVHHMGSVFPPSAAYEDLDVVLCPSRQESFGRVVAEAMLNGLPVVASRIPAFEELLHDTAEYALFDLDSPASAGALLAALADDPSLAERVGKRNAITAHQFSAARVVPVFETHLS